MTISTLNKTRFCGLASAVPRRIRDNESFADVFSTTEIASVNKMTGVTERRWADEDTCTSDLCFSAADRLLNELDWSRDSVDALIFVTQSPDYIIPATACVLQQRLGLSTSCAAFDVTQGCSAYVYGYWLASSMISSGAARRVLLLVGDTSTKMLGPHDRATVMLFGDAGTASAFECDEHAAPAHFLLGTDGSGAKNLIVPAGGFRKRTSSETRRSVVSEDGNIRSQEDLFMNGSEIFKFTLQCVAPMVNELASTVGVSLDECDQFVFHQANTFILQHLSRKLGLPKDKVPLCMQQFGNTASASIPLTMSAALSQTLAAESQKLLLCGFGVGYSWASTIVDVGPIPTIEILEVEDGKTVGALAGGMMRLQRCAVTSHACFSNLRCPTSGFLQTMAVRFVNFEKVHEPAVRALNQRLAEGGSHVRFPDDSAPHWLPPRSGEQLFQEYYLGVDDGGLVRGAFIIKHQEFLFDGRKLVVHNIQLPVSEGVVDRRHAMVGVQLHKHVMERFRRLYGLGLGGFDKATAKLNLAMGHPVASVPFFFRVVSPTRFLRELPRLRAPGWKRIASGLLAISGGGWLGHRLMETCLRPARIPKGVTFLETHEFGEWADELWQQSGDAYRFIAVRDKAVLNKLYPDSRNMAVGWSRNPLDAEGRRFQRIQVRRGEQTIGWAVLLIKQMDDNQHFGNLRVGSIIDVFAAPEDAVTTLACATTALKQQGVDVIVSNQSHQIWCDALRRNAFLPGPSNFLFVTSPALEAELGPLAESLKQCHITRGDGDGPINL